ncbi:DUF1761 domain-containing protein [Clostridium sp. YIM B02505]|uniref:DUF1761 domain-containing protein n=1 Tax=Clostridium yunnanense TaxID=2800325 RepID=A0ABS1ETM1_9CLOT|nr:DUF1761 domain-containing protein [Clostridium yunnanense]MBK1812730.1 DUF1761 domain-containing protein [Clostridium yunnanense]
MFNMISEINWIAVLLATIANSLLGGFWFTAIWGKAYFSALGKERGKSEKPAPIFIFGPLVCGLITTVAMAILIYAFNIESLSDAIIFGGIVGVGLLASTTVNTAINPNMPRPILYGVISGSYFILAGLIISLILVAMK